MWFGLNIQASSNPLSHVVQHELFRISVGGVEISVTNHMVMMLTAALLLSVAIPWIVRRRGVAPSGFYNVIETVCVFLREQVARPSLGAHTDRFVPFLWTLFFFILVMNLLGMIPSDGILLLLSGGRLKHLGGTATANIYVTAALAAGVFVMIHVSGIREQGILSYVKNFIPHVPWPLIPVMYVLELIGALVKPFALAIRLFANMLAGHTVIGALLGIAIAAKTLVSLSALGLVTAAGCAALSMLELFVAFLQAYIFTYLTAMFIGAAVHPEH
ncbi:MAG: F0F1 ATP synthase subunit A [Sedimentisphaerales bacterium]|nr:F0F1 ATP synthase subunit A [Sedimentisphaerales bacterium]